MDHHPHSTTSTRTTRSAAALAGSDQTVLMDGSRAWVVATEHGFVDKEIEFIEQKTHVPSAPLKVADVKRHLAPYKTTDVVGPDGELVFANKKARSASDMYDLTGCGFGYARSVDLFGPPLPDSYRRERGLPPQRRPELTVYVKEVGAKDALWRLNNTMRFA